MNGPQTNKINRKKAMAHLNPNTDKQEDEDQDGCTSAVMQHPYAYTNTDIHVQ